MNVGVLSLVKLSLSKRPESLPAARSGADGGEGGVMSTVNVLALLVPVLLASSDCVACAV